MPRVCTVCSHPERAGIETSLVARHPIQRIAAQHGLSATALRRHKAVCVSTVVGKARESADLVRASALASHLADVHARCERLADTAEARGQYGAAAAATRELRATLEF